MIQTQKFSSQAPWGEKFLGQLLLFVFLSVSPLGKISHLLLCWKLLMNNTFLEIGKDRTQRRDENWEGKPNFPQIFLLSLLR